MQLIKDEILFKNGGDTVSRRTYDCGDHYHADTYQNGVITLSEDLKKTEAKTVIFCYNGHEVKFDVASLTHHMNQKRRVTMYIDGRFAMGNLTEDDIEEIKENIKEGMFSSLLGKEA